MNRDSFNQYVVTMFEIEQTSGKEIKQISFVFDTGASYTMVSKNIAESRGWKIFRTGIVLGSYVVNGAATICDLRKIPKLAFGIMQIDDLVIATPQDENEEVANLLGRSFIDNFQHGIDQDKNRIYFKKRNVAVDPDFSFSQILLLHRLNIECRLPRYFVTRQGARREHSKCYVTDERRSIVAK
jgi:hypothetical protein